MYWMCNVNSLESQFYNFTCNANPFLCANLCLLPFQHTALGVPHTNQINEWKILTYRRADRRKMSRLLRRYDSVQMYLFDTYLSSTPNPLERKETKKKKHMEIEIRGRKSRMRHTLLTLRHDGAFIPFLIEFSHITICTIENGKKENQNVEDKLIFIQCVRSQSTESHMKFANIYSNVLSSHINMRHNQIVSNKL